MATYVVISDWTQKGVANIADTVSRYEAGRSLLEGMGVSFKEADNLCARAVLRTGT